jgi:hypothetical protein
MSAKTIGNIERRRLKGFRIGQIINLFIRCHRMKVEIFKGFFPSEQQPKQEFNCNEDNL